MTRSVWYDICDTAEEAEDMEARSLLMIGCETALSNMAGVPAEVLHALINGHIHEFTTAEVNDIFLRLTVFAGDCA